MHRLAALFSHALLLGSALLDSNRAAFASDAKATGRALLAKRGLTNFDWNGDGKLNASERAAVVAARHVGGGDESASVPATNEASTNSAAILSAFGYSTATTYSSPYAESTGYGYAPNVYANSGSYLAQDNGYLSLRGPRLFIHSPIGPMALGYHHGDPRIPNLCPSRISGMRIIPY
ncbi:MAG TPA: hypothetical protein VMF30_10325 [Pirellulales bacterium]|nr:hypothetical protein [Pirellulales bacterium]